MIGIGKYSVKFKRRRNNKKDLQLMTEGELEVTDTLIRFSSSDSTTASSKMVVVMEIQKKDILCVIPTPMEISTLNGSGKLSLKQIQRINLQLESTINNSFSFITITRSNSLKILKKVSIKYYTFYFDDKDFKLDSQSSSSRSRSSGSIKKKKNLLFLLNPFSGSGKSVRIFQNIVEPLLKLCGLEYELVTTEYSQHAQELVANLVNNNNNNNKDEYSAIITVSGDGLFHEVVNGLYNSSSTTTSSSSTTSYIPPIGVIPAGTGNALVQSLLGSCLVELSVLNIVQMETRKMDLFSYQVEGQERRVGFLEVMWAFVADVDLESEFMRWAGSFRNTLAAVYRLIKFRNYEGTLYYYQRSSSREEESVVVPETYTWDSVKQEIDSGNSKKFVKVDGTFCYFMAMNTAWCAEDCLVAPDALVDDGLLDLVYIQNGTRGKMLKFLLDTESGKYVHEPYVEYHQTAAFVLEPKKFQEKYGALDVDGELVEYGRVLVQVLPQKCTVIAPSSW